MDVLDRVRRTQIRLPERVARGMRPQVLPSGVSGWLDAQFMSTGHDPLYVEAVELLDLRPDDDLVEVACGVGALLQRHATGARYVAGLDHSPMQVGFARKRLADRIAAGTAEVVLGDAAALPWPDGRFSAAVCVAGLDLMTDQAAALREIRRVLGPGGRAVVTAGLRFAEEAARQRYVRMGFWAPTEEQVRDLVRDAGFDQVRFSSSSEPSGIGGALAVGLGTVLYGAYAMRLVRADVAK
jgi:ubiquinone/menaquinone biosynthesis C-methylase UbiE